MESVMLFSQDQYGDMKPNPEGKWIHRDAYAALQAQHEKLVKETGELRKAFVQAQEDLKREVDLCDTMTAQRIPIDDDEVREFVIVALARHTLLNSDERKDCADQILTAFAPMKQRVDFAEAELERMAGQPGSFAERDRLLNEVRRLMKLNEVRLGALQEIARTQPQTVMNGNARMGDPDHVKGGWNFHFIARDAINKIVS